MQTAIQTPNLPDPSNVASNTSPSLDVVRTPPLKIQGIKTKVVKFIHGNISWEGSGR